MKGFFFPLLAKNVENIEFVSKQNHCKILNAIARGGGVKIQGALLSCTSGI